MDSKEFLNKIITVKIDRPLGSKHPKHNYIYPLNYGFVPNTISGDNEEIDCYVLGIHDPIDTFTGKCIAIIHRLNDDDDKLIITSEDKNFTDSEIRVLTDFQEKFFESEIIRPSDYIDWNENIPELSVTNLSKSLSFYKTIGFHINYEYHPKRGYTGLL